jgi:hypothetical protein
MWIRNLNKEVLIVVLVFAGLARAGESSALKPLYDQHRWFELHEAVQHQEAPALYKGALRIQRHQGGGEVSKPDDQAGTQFC